MNLVLLAVLFLAGLIVCLEIGYFLGVRRAKSVPNAHEGFGAIEAAVFGIFGLLLSLSFVGAGSRLDVRRSLIVEETNAMADAYTLVDLLPASDQPDVRRLFREYVDLRLLISQEPDEALDESQIHHSRSLQQAILLHAINATKTGDAGGARLLLSATNQMKDVATKKTIAKQTHLSTVVFALLAAAALLSGLVAGFGMARGRRNWLSVVVYALIVTITLYVMLDMEYPRNGLIGIATADRAMIDFRDSIQ
jgi:ABC-type glycerol-3-phosphate transport system permease component